MIHQKISRFNSIMELRESLDERIKELDNKIELQSKLIGKKIREGEKNSSEELSDLKAKLNPEKSKDAKEKNKKSKDKKSDNKKKKSKKGESENWIDFEGLHLYNGVGTRGELEF